MNFLKKINNNLLFYNSLGGFNVFDIQDIFLIKDNSLDKPLEKKELQSKGLQNEEYILKELDSLKDNSNIINKDIIEYIRNNSKNITKEGFYNFKKIIESINKNNKDYLLNKEENNKILLENHLNILSGINLPYINFYFKTVEDLKSFSKNDNFIKNLNLSGITYRFYIDYTKDIDELECLKNFKLKLLKNKINHIFLYYVGIKDELKKNINGEYLLKIDLGNDYNYLFDKINLHTLKSYIEDYDIKGAEVILNNLTEEQLKEINLLENTYNILNLIMGPNKLFKINFLEAFFLNKEKNGEINNNIITNNSFKTLLSNYLCSFINKQDGYINLSNINDIEVVNFFTIIFIYNRALLFYFENKKTEYLMKNNFFNILYLIKNFYIKDDYISVFGYDGIVINKCEILESVQELLFSGKILNIIDNNLISFDTQSFTNILTGLGYDELLEKYKGIYKKELGKKEDDKKIKILENNINQIEKLQKNYKDMFDDIMKDILKKIL